MKTGSFSDTISFLLYVISYAVILVVVGLRYHYSRVVRKMAEKCVRELEDVVSSASAPLLDNQTSTFTQSDIGKQSIQSAYSTSALRVRDLEDAVSSASSTLFDNHTPTFTPSDSREQRIQSAFSYWALCVRQLKDEFSSASTRVLDNQTTTSTPSDNGNQNIQSAYSNSAYNVDSDLVSEADAFSAFEP